MRAARFTSLRSAWAPYGKGLSVSLSSKKTPKRKTRTVTSTSVTSAAINPNVVDNIDINDEIKDSFMAYAMSTILSRALPDVRDGLKPVHRRVLYAMHGLKLTPDTPYRKCARIVGEVLGKYHPHGDQSVYGALVRMAQPFVMAHPLVDGHGNFGSVDDDPAAAMRYTEARMSSLTQDALMVDIKEETVDFRANFDCSEVEPSVLPSRVPLLLLNGSNGIAVSVTTNIPPHNLGELMRAVIALVKDPNITAKALAHIIPGPDFPTHGAIIGASGSKDLHLKGTGSIVLRGTATISPAGKGKDVIVITELPYMVVKSDLVKDIAQLVNEKKIDGIATIRDESDRDGMRIVIELKKATQADVVLDNLYVKTKLQSVVSCTMRAVVDEGRKPELLTLKRALQLFIDFRFETIMRRSRFQLRQQERRLHILQGLSIALGRIDDTINAIRSARDLDDARTVLTSTDFNMSSMQADAVLALRLSRLARLEADKVKAEEAELTMSVECLRNILSDKSKVVDIIIAESEEIIQRHAIPRRSIILEEQHSITTEDSVTSDRRVVKKKRAIPRRSITLEEQHSITTEDSVTSDRCVVSISVDGYIKRQLTQDFDNSLASMGSISTTFSCHLLDPVIFMKKNGEIAILKAIDIPTSPRGTTGTALPEVVPCDQADALFKVLPVASKLTGNLQQCDHIILVSEMGHIKKISNDQLLMFESKISNIVKLTPEDTLRWAVAASPAHEIFVTTGSGHIGRWKLEEIKKISSSMKGTRAVRSVISGIVDLDCAIPAPSGKEFLLTITKKGNARLFPLAEIKHNTNKTMGTPAFKFGKTSNDCVVQAKCCSLNDIAVIRTASGTILKVVISELVQIAGTSPTYLSYDDSGNNGSASLLILSP